MEHSIQFSSRTCLNKYSSVESLSISIRDEAFNINLHHNTSKKQTHCSKQVAGTVTKLSRFFFSFLEYSGSYSKGTGAKAVDKKFTYLVKQKKRKEKRTTSSKSVRQIVSKCFIIWLCRTCVTPEFSYTFALFDIFISYDKITIYATLQASEG